MEYDSEYGPLCDQIRAAAALRSATEIIYYFHRVPWPVRSRSQMSDEARQFARIHLPTRHCSHACRSWHHATLTHCSHACRSWHHATLTPKDALASTAIYYSDHSALMRVTGLTG